METSGTGQPVSGKIRITEIGAHKLRLHATFTMDIIKGRLLSDAFSDVFMSCICFADTVNICGNKHIFIVIVIVIVIIFENIVESKWQRRLKSSLEIVACEIFFCGEVTHIFKRSSVPSKC